MKTVIKFLREHSDDFTEVQVAYDANNPFSRALEVYLLDGDLRLRFDPKTQLLSHIDIFNSNYLEITYENGIICSPSSPASFASVYYLLGPTHAGVLDMDTGWYKLEYPGISFSFPIPEEFQRLYCEADPPRMPIELPDGTTPTANQITIHRSNLEKYKLDGVIDLVIDDEDFFVQSTVKGIKFLKSGREILFKSKPQDALSILGDPSEVHRKVHSVSIHRKAKEAFNIQKEQKEDRQTEDAEEIDEEGETENELEDYVLNYFEYGIDLVYNARSNLLKAISLHSNLPGHYLFPDRYSRCRYIIHLEEELDISYTAKFSEFKDKIGKLPPPLVLNLAKTSDSRFSCYLHSCGSFFFEVTQQDYISRLTILID